MKVLSFITCEDVRREADGKTTLVGMYEALNVKSTAFAAGGIAIRVATHMRLLLDPGERPDHLHIKISYNDVVAAEADATINIVSADKPLNLGSPMITVPVTGPGEMRLEYRFNAGDAPVGDLFVHTFRVDTVD
jgi:hypothetical protein